MNFNETQKTIRIGDKEIIIKRPGIKYYYEFLENIYQLKTNPETIEKILIILNLFIHTDDIEFNVKYLKIIINEIINYNTIKKQIIEGINDEIEDYTEDQLLEILEMNYIHIIDILTDKGWSINYIENNINNIQAYYLLRENKNKRAGNVIDTAVGFTGDIKEHVNSILGRITIGV